MSEQDLCLEGIKVYLEIGGSLSHISHAPSVRNAITEILTYSTISSEVSLIFFLCGIITPPIDLIYITYSGLNVPTFPVLVKAFLHYEVTHRNSRSSILVRLRLLHNLFFSMQNPVLQQCIPAPEWLKICNMLISGFPSIELYKAYKHIISLHICTFINLIIPWKHSFHLQLEAVKQSVKHDLFPAEILIPDKDISKPYYSRVMTCTPSVIHFLCDAFPIETVADTPFEGIYNKDPSSLLEPETTYLLSHSGKRPGFLDWVMKAQDLQDLEYIHVNDFIYETEMSWQVKLNTVVNKVAEQNDQKYYLILHANCRTISSKYTGNITNVFQRQKSDDLRILFHNLRQYMIPSLWFHLRKESSDQYYCQLQDCIIKLGNQNKPDLLLRSLAAFDAKIRNMIQILYQLHVIPDLMINILLNLIMPAFHDTFNQAELAYLRKFVFSLCKSFGNQ